jgi:hypothetical protein
MFGRVVQILAERIIRPACVVYESILLLPNADTAPAKDVDGHRPCSCLKDCLRTLILCLWKACSATKTYHKLPEHR